MAKEIQGHIDCPSCGASKRMRVTCDKNGDPFGFCEECRQQLRVGGDAHRVAKFRERHPWAAPGAAPVTETVPEPVPAPAPAPAPAAKPKAKSSRSVGPFDYLYRQGARA